MTNKEISPEQVAQIERIVRDVLGMLPDAPTAAASDELVLTDRVISVDMLAGRLDRVKSVATQQGAVVTPAAKDLLKESGITLTYRPAQQQVGHDAVLVLGVAEEAGETAALARATVNCKTSIERLARAGLLDMVAEMCEEVVKGGKLGLLVTSRTTAAVCLANRRAGVRAVAARNARNVQTAVADVGANLLVVESVGLGTAALQRLVQVFVGATPHRCPAELVQHLG